MIIEKIVERNMANGYTGKVLHVNLTKGELTVEEPEEKFYRTTWVVVRWDYTMS